MARMDVEIHGAICFLQVFVPESVLDMEQLNYTILALILSTQSGDSSSKSQWLFSQFNALQVIAHTDS